MVDIKKTLFFEKITGNAKQNSIYEHEKMRFNTMDDKQLFARLGKMTKPDKIEMFIKVSGELCMYNLQKAAREKLVALGMGISTEPKKSVPIKNPVEESTYTRKPKVQPAPKPVQKEEQKPLRRHLEF